MGCFVYGYVAELSSEVASEEREDNSPVSPDPLSAIGNRDEFGDNFLAEEDIFISPNGSTPRSEPGHESEQVEMKTSRDSGIKASQTNGFAFRNNSGVLNGSTMKHVFELKGPSLRSSPRTKDDESVASAVSPFSLKRNGDGKEATNGLLGSPLRVGSPLHLNPFEVPCSPQVWRSSVTDAILNWSYQLSSTCPMRFVTTETFCRVVFLPGSSNQHLQAMTLIN